MVGSDCFHKTSAGVDRRERGAREGTAWAGPRPIDVFSRESYAEHKDVNSVHTERGWGARDSMETLISSSESNTEHLGECVINSHPRAWIPQLIAV